MSTEHIDPFAPADSPQHPANHGRAQQPDTDAGELAEDYDTLIEKFGTEAEKDAAGAGDGPTLEELRGRETEYVALFDEHVSDADRAHFQATGETPSLDDLRSRAAAANVRGGAVEFVVDLGTAAADAPKRPAKDARRDDWVDYAKVLDPDLTDEDLKPITVPGLREMTALQDGTAQADA